MSSGSPSPNSSPSAVPPVSSTTSPPPPVSASPPPTPSTTSPPPAVPQPNAGNDSPPPSTPSNSSTPPPQSPPPTVPAVPPPVALSPPPSIPPPSPPLATPPVVSSSPPPPVVDSPPPVSRPPPPQAIPPSPPSPVISPPTPTTNSPPPLPSTSPPPPSAIPPQNSPPPPRRTPSSPNTPQLPSPPPPPRNSPPKLPPPPTNQPNPTPPSPPLPPSTSPRTNTSSGSSPPIPTPSTPGVPTGVPTNNSSIPSVPETASAPSSNSNGMNTGSLVGIGVVVGFVVLSLLAMTVWCLKRQKKKVAGFNGGYVMPSPQSSQKSDASFLKVHVTSPPVRGAASNELIYSPSQPLNNSRSWFTYEELLEVTNGFSKQNVLGEGGFGCVYKGCLADGREVAVKQLKVGGSQGEREFKAEVETISRVHHRHLVSLVGYCISDNHRLLVYDYVPNNTLYYHLHGEGRPIMNWATRMKVAAGAARGIAYLHEDCHPRIIHRDIKSSNILLDNNFEALVADFGLAKLALDAYTHITTRVMGTFGYMAPEYASSGKLTEKSDVYSYGVVLLELITGRKPVDVSQPLGDESLVEWARPLLNQALDNQEFGELVDPTLESNYVAGEMFRMVEAAAACVRHSAGRRPRMGQVLRALDCSDHSSDLINGMKPGQSEIYDSAQQSAEIRLFQRMAFGSQNYSSGIFSGGSYG